MFIFSGYDIFSVFFSLLGLQAYFAKDFKKFALWFSVAISFKYFAALIFLPLVLIVEKRFLYLIGYGLLGVTATLLQFLLYWQSDVFLGEIFHRVAAKTTDGGVHLKLVICTFVYASMCGYLYFFRINIDERKQSWQKHSIFACLLAYALMFTCLQWHPQWLVLLLPFTCLAYLFVRTQKILLWLEISGYLGFIAFCINNWIGNVDITMVYAGVFGELVPKAHLLGSDLIGRHVLGISRTAFYVFLYSPILVLIWEKCFLARGTLGSSLKLPIAAFQIRFFIGVYFFTALTLACVWFANNSG